METVKSHDHEQLTHAFQCRGEKQSGAIDGVSRLDIFGLVMTNTVSARHENHCSGCNPETNSASWNAPEIMRLYGKASARAAVSIRSVMTFENEPGGISKDVEISTLHRCDNAASSQTARILASMAARLNGIRMPDIDGKSHMIRYGIDRTRMGRKPPNSQPCVVVLRHDRHL